MRTLPVFLAAACGLLAGGCVLPGFDATGKSCSAATACPSPFVCVLSADAGVCVKDPCQGDPRIGTACDAGLGACLRAGTFVCAAQPGSSTAEPIVCNAVPGSPAAEICNGIDDDCDGIVDDHLTDETLCELDAGVCSGKLRACIDGGYERPCTALSYGPTFESVETRCDGLDNDCDGRVDVSKSVPLPIVGDQMEWAADPGGIQVVYRRGQAVFWQRLDPVFGPLSGPVLLSDAGAYWPIVRASGASSVVAWVEGAAGAQTMQLATLDGSGRPSWAGDAGVLRTSVSTALPPRLALTPGGVAVAMWLTADGGWLVDWLAPMDAGSPPAPSTLPGATSTGGFDVAAGPGDAGPDFTYVTSSGAASGLLNLNWLWSNGNSQFGPLIYSTTGDGFVDARAAADVASYVDIGDGGFRTLFWLTAQPPGIGTATPELVSNDVTTADVVGTSGGSFVAWQTRASGIRGSFFNQSGAIATGTFLPPGFQSPLLTWNGTSASFALAASLDGGTFYAENICPFDAGL